MARKLFCEISPAAYRISVARLILKRRITDAVSPAKFAGVRQEEKLPVVIYAHNSLIRRRLGNVDMELQNNKAVNLGIAAPKVNTVLIRPGETFSFWKLVGSTSEKKGYRKGLTIANGATKAGIGGGMCQFTNLIHWLVLHSPLEITEHHHHDGYDLFPDFNRQVPFGTGTSIFYNYLDYRFTNPTDVTFQLIVYVTEEYLCGELRAEKPLPYSYHIRVENERFIQEDDVIYRCGEVYRRTVDKFTGNTVKDELLRSNHARVMYDLDLSQIPPRSAGNAKEKAEC